MTKKQQKRNNQIAYQSSLASVDANVSGLPQTVWETNDPDWPMQSMATVKMPSDLRAKPIITVLPKGYFD